MHTPILDVSCVYANIVYWYVRLCDLCSTQIMLLMGSNGCVIIRHVQRINTLE